MNGMLFDLLVEGDQSPLFRCRGMGFLIFRIPEECGYPQVAE